MTFVAFSDRCNTSTTERAEKSRESIRLFVKINFQSSEQNLKFVAFNNVPANNGERIQKNLSNSCERNTELSLS